MLAGLLAGAVWSDRLQGLDETAVFQWSTFDSLLSFSDSALRWLNCHVLLSNTVKRKEDTGNSTLEWRQLNASCFLYSHYQIKRQIFVRWLWFLTTLSRTSERVDALFTCLFVLQQAVRVLIMLILIKITNCDGVRLATTSLRSKHASWIQARGRRLMPALTAPPNQREGWVAG